MFIVPHEDDEVIFAGSFIYSLTQNNIKDVYVVFLTNGDYRGKDMGLIRINEAVDSCKKLGIEENNVFFLGYPDIGPGEENTIFNFEEGFEFNGISETYGNDKFSDYHFLKHGHHAKYGMKNMRADLEEIILDYKPDFVVYNDNDFHPIHRILSMTLDGVINKIYRENELYRPEVYKGFAYDISWLSGEDFTVYNLSATKTNSGAITLSNPYLSIDDLIRFPMVPEISEGLIYDNPIFKAAKCHKTQLAAYLSDRYINADSCFSRKRFDNIIGKTAHLSKEYETLYNANTWYTNTPWIVRGEYVDYDISAVNVGNEIEITLDKAFCGSIFIYKAFKSKVNEIKISTSKESYIVKAVNSIFKLKNIKSDNSIKIEALDGEELLLNEIELFEETPDDNKPWFIKLKVGNEYAYRHYCKNPKKCEISAVVYNKLGEDITESEEVIIDKTAKGKVKAYLKNNADISDEIEIKKLNLLRVIKFRYLTFKNNYMYRYLREVDVKGKVSVVYIVKLFIKCLIGR